MQNIKVRPSIFLAANRDTFAANPVKFAPQYGGYCVFGLAKGYKAAIDPGAFTVWGTTST
jgi:hypothetical protein